MKEIKTIETKIVVDKEMLSKVIDEAVKKEMDKLKAEQRPCAWCIDLKDKELVRFNGGNFYGVTASYCPNCGREL